MESKNKNKNKEINFVKNKSEEKSKDKSFNVKLEIDKNISGKFINEENTIKIKIIKEMILKGIDKGFISPNNFDKIEKELVKIFLSK